MPAHKQASRPPSASQRKAVPLGHNSGPVLLLALREVVRAAANTARFCDRSEHAEHADRTVVSAAAASCRSTALVLGEALAIDVFDAYANRLSSIERCHALSTGDGFDGGDAVRAARTWRDIQVAQAEHDRRFHPDVFGLSRLDQVRHFALHLTKLAGALCDAGEAPGPTDAFLTLRLPDLLLFGVKMSTVMNEVLPSEPLSRSLRADGRS